MDRKNTVLEIVEKKPGIRFNEIMRISNIKNGTLSHYVKKLADAGDIILEQSPRVTRMYPSGISKKGDKNLPSSYNTHTKKYHSLPLEK